MGDNKYFPETICLLRNLTTIGFGGDNRLFTKDMVVVFHRCENGLEVHRILGRNDDPIDIERFFKQLFPILAGQLFGNTMLCCNDSPFRIIRFCNRHYLQVIGVLFCIISIHISASVSRS